MPRTTVTARRTVRPNGHGSGGPGWVNAARPVSFSTSGRSAASVRFASAQTRPRNSSSRNMVLGHRNFELRFRPSAFQAHPTHPVCILLVATESARRYLAAMALPPLLSAEGHR